jgi:hypothetical protein
VSYLLFFCSSPALREALPQARDAVIATRDDEAARTLLEPGACASHKYLS